MSLLRRLAAALSIALLLQLSLLGSGTLCPMHGGAGSMDHASPHANAVSATTHRCDGSKNGGCPLPWAPGQQCASMAGCTVTPASLPTLVMHGEAMDNASAVSELTRIVISNPAAAPELPPPRA